MLTLSDEEIYAIARRAVHCTLRGRWEPFDIADATQEAAIAIWQEAQRDRAEGHGYLFRTGQSHVRRWIWRRPTDLFLFDDVDPPEPDPDEPAFSGQAIDSLLSKLTPLMRKRHKATVDRTIVFLRLRLRRVSLAGIAMHFGVSCRQASIWSTQTIAILKDIQSPPKAKTAQRVRAASVENLRRAREDPERNAARIARIREALAARQAAKSEEEIQAETARRRERNTACQRAYDARKRLEREAAQQ